MAFANNTSFHRSVKSTPFKITFGMEARAPDFNTTDARKGQSTSIRYLWFLHQTLHEQLFRFFSLEYERQLGLSDDFQHFTEDVSLPTRHQPGYFCWRHHRSPADVGDMNDVTVVSESHLPEERLRRVVTFAVGQWSISNWRSKTRKIVKYSHHPNTGHQFGYHKLWLPCIRIARSHD